MHGLARRALLWVVEAGLSSASLHFSREGYAVRRSCCVVSLFTLLVLAAPDLHAQDARRVVEPHFLVACVVLPARLAAGDGVLPADAEKDTDTARIQQA